MIAAVEGPAVAGGMELAMWSDVRVMAESAYFGVYCRRWGVPLIDGGTVRLPRLVGMGKAMEIIMTGRKVTAEESYRIGLCEKVVPHSKAREAAEAMAQEIARFPQECMRSDRLSAYRAWGKSVREGLESEWATSPASSRPRAYAGPGALRTARAVTAISRTSEARQGPIIRAVRPPAAIYGRSERPPLRPIRRRKDTRCCVATHKSRHNDRAL